MHNYVLWLGSTVYQNVGGQSKHLDRKLRNCKK